MVSDAAAVLRKGFEMRAACALRIIRGISFLFGIQKSLRAFLNPLFTSGVVTVSCICNAAFCESAALRKESRIKFDLPFVSMTPPVKKSPGKIRRFSRGTNYK